MARAALRKRGSLLIWLDKEMAWFAPHDGSPGRPEVFSNAAIQFCLSIRCCSSCRSDRPPGWSPVCCGSRGWTGPFRTTPRCVGGRKTLKVQIPYRRAGGPLNLLVDSTGIKFLGDGEWQPASMAFRGDANGARCIWQWTPPHPTSAQWSLPPAGKATAPSCRTCWTRSPKTRHRRRDRGWRLRHPPLPQRHHRTRRNGHHPHPQERPSVEGRLPSRQDAQRNPARLASLRPCILEAVDRIPRTQSRRSQDALAGSLEPVALNLLDLKSFGERIAARDPDRQIAEIHIRVALMNRFNAFGTAEIVRVV